MPSGDVSGASILNRHEGAREHRKAVNGGNLEGANCCVDAIFLNQIVTGHMQLRASSSGREPGNRSVLAYGRKRRKPFIMLELWGGGCGAQPAQSNWYGTTTHS